MIGLTIRQRRVLVALAALQRGGGGIGYSLAEIADAMGRTKSWVWYSIDGLAERGYVRRLKHRARSIEITPLALATVSEIEFDGCCWGFIPACRLGIRPYGEPARYPAARR